MVDKNDSLLREVEDELRQDQLKKLWADYGTYLIAAAALVIVGVFAFQQIDSWHRAAAEAEGARYEAARRLLDQKSAQADSAFADIAKSGSTGYASLARLETAASLVKANKTAEAVAAYDAIAGDSNANQVMRDFARLQVASLKLGTADWTELQNRLSGLTDEQSAFRSLAREFLGLAAQKAGRHEEARKLFLQVVSDAKASQAQKDRVSGFLSALVAADLGKAAVGGADVAAPDKPEKK